MSYDGRAFAYASECAATENPELARSAKGRQLPSTFSGVPSERLISLDTAVARIKSESTGWRRSARATHFFMVGSGISSPEVPLAAEMVERFKVEVAKEKGPQPPAAETPASEYQMWFQAAYPAPAQRQDFLDGLIRKKPISRASFRLAHLLVTGRVTNLVVTSNFDDFVSRALHLFGHPHIVCDHPATTRRVDAVRKEVQLVHTNGTYRFYDSCNTVVEFAERTNSRAGMRRLLESLLQWQSPIVIGFGGWETDVFMEALRGRLEDRQRELAYNIYWFCFHRTSLENLPAWLTAHEKVFFVVPDRARPDVGARSPDASPTDSSETWPPPDVLGTGSDDEGACDGEAAGQDSESMGTSCHSAGPVLPATAVLEAFIRIFRPRSLRLTRNPLAWYADMLEESLLPKSPGVGPGIATPSAVDDIRIKMAAKAVRESKHEKALGLLRSLDIATLAAADLLRSIECGLVAAENASMRARGAGFAFVCNAASALPADYVHEQTLAESAAGRGLIGLGQAYLRSSKWPDAQSAFEEVHSRFDARQEQHLQVLVAKSLLGLGRCHRNSGNPRLAVRDFEEVLDRFGDCSNTDMQEAVASTLLSKGGTLRCLDKDGAVSSFDELARRYGDSADPRLRILATHGDHGAGEVLASLGRVDEALARFKRALGRLSEAEEPEQRHLALDALLSQTECLHEAGRSEEAIGVCDEILRRTSNARDFFEEFAASKAFVMKGLGLSALGRYEEAIVADDELAERLRGDARPALLIRVATAQINKGDCLRLLKRQGEAIDAYGEVLLRFGDSPDVELQLPVARALLGEGKALRESSCPNDADAAWRELVRRFDGTQDSEIEHILGQAKKALSETVPRSSAPEPAEEEYLGQTLMLVDFNSPVVTGDWD
jgi:tetratricopeptide (TPR) repeat protein